VYRLFAIDVKRKSDH